MKRVQVQVGGLSPPLFPRVLLSPLTLGFRRSRKVPIVHLLYCFISPPHCL